MDRTSYPHLTSNCIVQGIFMHPEDEHKVCSGQSQTQVYQYLWWVVPTEFTTEKNHIVWQLRCKPMVQRLRYSHYRDTFVVTTYVTGFQSCSFWCLKNVMKQIKCFTKPIRRRRKIALKGSLKLAKIGYCKE